MVCSKEEGTMEIPKNLEPILNIGEEEDSGLQELAYRKKAVLLALVAPYVPEKISPTQYLSASLGLSEEFGIETVISHVRKTTKVRKLFIAINTPGGAVDSSYKIAKALGKSFDDITVFVPYLAASGGTLISLLGKEIVMGLMSHLTPIDPQWGSTPLNSLPRAFSKLVEYFEKKDKKDAPYPWIALTDKIDPVELETYNGIITTVRNYAFEILLNVHRGRKSPEDISKIANFLIEGFSSHSALLGLERVSGIGLPGVPSSEYGADWELMRDWIGRYFLKSDSQHFIRCVIPKKIRKPKPATKDKTNGELKATTDGRKSKVQLRI